MGGHTLTTILQNGIKQKLKKKHLEFCKLYLGVNRKTSNLASRGELGRWPLIIPILESLRFTTRPARRRACKTKKHVMRDKRDE